MHRIGLTISALLRIIALSSVLTTAAWATADEGSIGLVNPSGPTEVAPGQNFGFTVNVVMGEGDKSIDTSSIVVELLQYGEVVAVSSTTE